jgi:hypothetical protein
VCYGRCSQRKSIDSGLEADSLMELEQRVVAVAVIWRRTLRRLNTELHLQGTHCFNSPCLRV